MSRFRVVVPGALVAVLAAVFVTAPPAVAIRDASNSATCQIGGGEAIQVSIYVTWYAFDDHRYWRAQADTVTGDLNIGRVNTIDMYSEAIGGSWVDQYRATNPPPPPYYVWANFTPLSNPGQGHYFRNRATWNGYTCDTAVLN